jgi:hypothetical protein
MHCIHLNAFHEIIDDMSEHAAHDADVDGIKKVKYLEAPNAKDRKKEKERFS